MTHQRSISKNLYTERGEKCPEGHNRNTPTDLQNELHIWPTPTNQQWQCITLVEFACFNIQN